MKKESTVKIFADYIKQYRFGIILFVLSLLICFLVFTLYSLEAEAVLYSFGLSLAMFLTVGTVRFVFYAKRYRERKNLLSNIRLLSGSMPKAETPMEQDYQDMISTLKHDLDSELTQRDSLLQDNIEYYTTWVHQIKIPISVMQMILQGEDTQEHHELSSQLFRIEQYVEMVLNYSRLGGSSDFVFKSYDIDAIIKQAVHKYAPQFIRKHIGLRYDPVSIEIVTDAKWLSFMLEQLLSNAVKYTQQGTVTITVSEDKILSIADTGIGIAKEDLPRIFEKGYTGYNGRENKKSTGIGLYLCKLTADRLSHKISVESVAGQGSVFSVDLNRYELEAE